MKKKRSNILKFERNRFSLFNNDKSKCYFCNSKYNLTWHETNAGRNRNNSMRYGLCLKMCLACHEKYQNDKSFNDTWHKKGQIKFEKYNPDLEFIKVFFINYL